MISRERAGRLREAFEPWIAGMRDVGRVDADPVAFPIAYEDPAEQEVVGLIAACFAYGRADLFREKIRWILERMGPSPAAFVAAFEPGRDGRRFEGFVYRFHRSSDLLVLLAGVGEALRRHGSLAALFEEGMERGGGLQGGLSHFATRIAAWGLEQVPEGTARQTPLAHLLPDAARGGSCKRLLLYLRWMVRRDDVDLGTWEGVVPPSELVIPLDTHVHRISRHLGLTKRKDASWRTAAEITEALRRLDPDDPLRFDFPLCHLGMSGVCPAALRTTHCERCPLRSACLTGRRRLARPRGGAPVGAASLG